MERRSQRALVFMGKWPEPGRAKTRLCPPLTACEAASLARAFLLDTLDEAARIDADRWIAFSPASSEDGFRRLIHPDVGLIPAEAVNFGVALESSQAAAFQAGYEQVALVASDLPHLPAERYLDAFGGLSAANVALGPCADGGYYLLASSQPIPHLFHGIAWSSAEVYRQTLKRAAEAGLRVGSIEGCDDVDTAAALGPLYAALSGQCRGRRSFEHLQRLGRGMPRPYGMR